VKAKDYLLKYQDKLDNIKNGDELIEIIINIYKDFKKDFYTIYEQRKPRTNEKILAIVNEVNQKYNTFISLYPKQFFKKDGFKNMFIHELERNKK